MTFEVETASLNSTVRKMETELNNVSQVAGRLYAALEALDGMWEGAAHDTFASQYLADQNILSEMYKTVGRVIEGMDSARKTYEQCEAAVSTEIKKIAI